MGENYKNIKHISEVSGADCSNAIATERKKVIRIEGKAAQVEHAKALLQKLIEAEEAKTKNMVSFLSFMNIFLIKLLFSGHSCSSDFTHTPATTTAARVAANQPITRFIHSSILVLMFY